MQGNEAELTKLAETRAIQFIKDMESSVDATKQLLARALEGYSSETKSKVVIMPPASEDGKIWSVILYRDRIYADESYAPRSLKGALTVAECLLNGTEPPKNYMSL